MSTTADQFEPLVFEEPPVTAGRPADPRVEHVYGELVKTPGKYARVFKGNKKGATNFRNRLHARAKKTEAGTIEAKAKTEDDTVTVWARFVPTAPVEPETPESKAKDVEPGPVPAPKSKANTSGK